eukprot:2375511-Pleurochrysis_carterae.AAC.1
MCIRDSLRQVAAGPHLDRAQLGLARAAQARPELARMLLTMPGPTDADLASRASNLTSCSPAPRSRRDRDRTA